MFVQVKPVIQHEVRNLCILPYPGHEEGCPHYGTRDICPPNAPLFDQYFDLDKPVYIIWITLDLADHFREMRKKHPHWQDEQVRDWQLWNAISKEALAREISAFLNRHPDHTPVQCPEAMGVNITETARRAGLVLEWEEPISTVHRIALAGIKR